MSERSAVAGDEVVEGTLVRVTFENEATGFRVLRVRPRERGRRPTLRARDEDDLVTVVGVMAPMIVGEEIRAIGERENDARHGSQLRAKVVTALTPGDPAGITRYLGGGAVPGVGPKIAARIVESFGAETVNILDHSPERLAEVKGLSAARAKKIGAAWKQHRSVRELMMQLSLLGVAPSLAMRIHKRYGERALEIVRREPYRLALEVWGVGFRTADAIAQAAGIAADDPVRAQAGMLHTLQTLAEEGHTVSPRVLLVERAARLLAGQTQLDDPEPPEQRLMERATEALSVLEKAALIERPDPGEPGFGLVGVLDQERTVATHLARLLAAPRALDGTEEAIARFSASTGVTLAPAQRAAVDAVRRHAAVVVTGGPGVGKTTVVRAILELLEASGLRTRLAAPTGRAAKRMTEATGRPAQTIHRLLEFDPRQGGFTRDRETPLELDALVVDESSMVDVALGAALLSAMPDGARLVLVGDVDQLPSIGPGALLRDAIESGCVPTARLSEVFRQAEGSRIVRGAHAILRGEVPEPSPTGAHGEGELFIIERKEPAEAAATIVEVVAERLPRAFGLDPMRAVQVLVPMVRGDVGTRALNAALQAKLNPLPAGGAELVRGERRFRVGDRVLQLRNDYDREVLNGDLGHVVALTGADPLRPTGLTVRLEEGRDVEYGPDDLDELSLAYACTVHKAQGSEYPAVVIGLVNQHFVMLARRLLYTAVTRARKLVVLIGTRWAIGQAVADARGEDRRTTLASALRRIIG